MPCDSCSGTSRPPSPAAAGPTTCARRTRAGGTSASTRMRSVREAAWRSRAMGRSGSCWSWRVAPPSAPAGTAGARWAAVTASSTARLRRSCCSSPGWSWTSRPSQRPLSWSPMPPAAKYGGQSSSRRRPSTSRRGARASRSVASITSCRPRKRPVGSSSSRSSRPAATGPAIRPTSTTPRTRPGRPISRSSTTTASHARRAGASRGSTRPSAISTHPLP